MYNIGHLGVYLVSRFSLRSDKFPFKHTKGGLYLNSIEDDMHSVIIGEPANEKKLPSGKLLIELSMTIPEMRQVRSLSEDYIEKLNNKFERIKRIRKIYFSKMLKLNCVDTDNLDKFYKDDDSYFEKGLMKVPFDINGDKKVFSNFTIDKVLYHTELDKLIEAVYLELFIYNTRMQFLITDCKGLELCKYLKNIEILDSVNEEASIHKCMYEALYKRIKNKIGVKISLAEFQNNYESYKTLYDMWRI